MDKSAAVGLTVVVGGLIALQAPINSGLGKRIGTLPAASTLRTRVGGRRW